MNNDFQYKLLTGMNLACSTIQTLSVISLSAPLCERFIEDPYFSTGGSRRGISEIIGIGSSPLDLVLGEENLYSGTTDNGG